MTLKELLNKLIEKGWKPRGDKIYNGIEVENYSIIFQCYDDEDKYIGTDIKNLRQLVSKESGLWQFVCENGMTEKKIKEYWEKFTGTQMLRYTDDYAGSMYEYYLIESALCDEDKLEEFLLDNIKIDE